MNNRFLSSMSDQLLCQECDAPLMGARWIRVLETSYLSMFHITCHKCQHQFILTAGVSGVELTSYRSDLTGQELINFISYGPITEWDLLDLHELIKEGNLWNLISLPENLLEKKQKIPVPRVKYLG